MIDILLVEDRDEDIEFTMRALQKHNLADNAKIIKDGEEAIRFIFATGEYSERNVSDLPKLIILDLKLPTAGGLEILRKIRSDERTNPAIVVMLTSSQEDSDLYESYKLGANSYIVKPVDFDEFIKVVSSIGYYWLRLNELPQ
jgi:CheY-like chemotaxis protein